VEWWEQIVRAIAAHYPEARWEFWLEHRVETPEGKRQNRAQCIEG
jgi:hypothetical protein